MSDKNFPMRSSQLELEAFVKGRDYNDLRDDLLQNHDHNPNDVENNHPTRGAQINHRWLSHGPDGSTGIRYEHEAIDDFINRGNGSNNYWYLLINGDFTVEVYQSNGYICEQGYDAGTIDVPNCNAARDWYGRNGGHSHMWAGICYPGHEWFVPLSGSKLDISKTLVWVQPFIRSGVANSCPVNCTIMPTPTVRSQGVRSDGLPYVKILLSGPFENTDANQRGCAAHRPDILDYGLNVILFGPQKNT